MATATPTNMTTGFFTFIGLSIEFSLLAKSDPVSFNSSFFQSLVGSDRDVSSDIRTLICFVLRFSSFRNVVSSLHN